MHANLRRGISKYHVAVFLRPECVAVTDEVAARTQRTISGQQEQVGIWSKNWVSHVLVRVCVEQRRRTQILVYM